MKRTILLLEDPELYEANEEVKIEEFQQMKQVQEDLKDTLLAFRARYGTGRAIAVPQTEVKERIIYRHLDTPVLSINPRLSFPEQDMVDVLDDCISSPDLLVGVKWYKQRVIYYEGLNWNDYSMELEGNMSELIQYEYDHLGETLATLRAMDERVFVIRPHRWIVQGSCEDMQTFQVHRRDDTE